MPKITDEGYSLPTIHALVGFRTLSSGSTEPMLLSGVDENTGARGQYVVKFMKAPRMSTKAACCELLGAWIGKELDMNVAEPVVIHISGEFADTLVGQDSYKNASNSVGLNFGTVYREGYSEMIVSSIYPNNRLFDQAKDVLALDTYLSNADRGAAKPNLLTNGDHFLLFDHELAFSFTSLLPFLRNAAPWILNDSEKILCRSHCLYPLLRKNILDFQEFVEGFSRINDYFWERVEYFIPDVWLSEQRDFVNDVRKHLQAFTTHKKEFSDSLTDVLIV